MTELDQLHPFINHLYSLKDDRAALAALRRGLGRKPGEAPEMFPYIVPFFPKNTSYSHENTYYLVASLFALHTSIQSSGNIGDHLAAVIHNDLERPAIERRFVNLLGTHPDDLGYALRQTISFLRSKEQPINWNRLFHDISSWDHPDRYVQRHWAASFWGRRAVAESTPAQYTDQTEV